MPAIRYWSCHYLYPADHWTWVWKPAILVEDSELVTVALATGDSQVIDAALVDRFTGQPVGRTFDFCVDRFCNQDDCGPMNLIAEVHSDA